MSSLIAPSPSGLLSSGASHPLTIACVVIANALIILIIYLIFFFWKHDKEISVGPEAFDDSMSTNSSPCSSPRASRVQANDLSFLPEFVHEETDGEAKKECAVCITEFSDGQIGRLLPACGHKFHRECKLKKPLSIRSTSSSLNPNRFASFYTNRLHFPPFAAAKSPLL
ncbi:hypothetical protein LUZ61_005916 [Rhynchospora tenuis]|uniref:RING-type domain-containing protein n=1 Tax=Rhynchospora tenuis TaxID=198213 RepID=A0AAD5ZQK0_9POAL|nr:hypothetical protein LUZ61_005916 [Rhynchospora tenuis]